MTARRERVGEPELTRLALPDEDAPDLLRRIHAERATDGGTGHHLEREGRDLDRAPGDLRPLQGRVRRRRGGILGGGLGFAGHILAKGVDIMLLADRGFGDQRLFAYFETIDWSYAIRFSRTRR